MIATFSGLTCPSRCAAASRGRTGSSVSPSIEVRGPTASAARTRRRRFGLGQAQRRGQHPPHRALTQRVRQVPALPVDDDLVIDHRQPVPQLFEGVHELDQRQIIQLLQATVIDILDQMIKTGDHRVEGVPDRWNLGGPSSVIPHSIRTSDRLQAFSLVHKESRPDASGQWHPTSTEVAQCRCPADERSYCLASRCQFGDDSILDQRQAGSQSPIQDESDTRRIT